MDPHSHLAEIRARLSISPIVQTVTVLQERVGYEYGYFRARAGIVNGDFLEVAEYFTVRDDRVWVQRYRYQWMDAAQKVLRRRWDNTRHFPELPNFPHHIHDGCEEMVVPGQVLSITDVITLLEDELQL